MLRKLVMKRRLLTFLLLLGLFISYFAVATFQEHCVWTSRTFRFTPSFGNGPRFQSGWSADVVCIERLPSGKVEARRVAKRVLMLDAHQMENTGRIFEEITLRVTRAQAQKLEEAQARGELQYSLCHPQQALTVKVQEYLFGPRKVTAAEILGRQ